MKIGLLTFTNGTNIGQRLQNFALQKVIEDIIPECEVMTIVQGYPFSVLKRNVKSSIAFLFHPKRELIKMERKKRFDSFNKKYIRFYPQEMPFYGDNTDFSSKFDCFVVGSDQIWNPNSPFVGSNFFLTFAKPQQRITYAPSFSVDELPRDKIEVYKKYLQGFSNITVREECGARIVSELTDVSVEVVLDPTLLLEKHVYDKIKIRYRHRPEKKYILALFLGVNPQNEIAEISRRLAMDVLYLTPDTVIGPDEFVDAVEHAEIVLTDSYHVTIFSIIYCRPFINFVRSGKGAIMNSRFETLYRILSIRNRTWSYLRLHPDKFTDIKFEEICSAVKREQVRCREILTRNLEYAINKR